MKNHFFKALAITILALPGLFFSVESKSIPAFARKYQISCQVCHSPATPRLKAFGDEFAGNGFRLTEYESPRYFIPAGDDRLSLFRELPLAIRLDGFATLNFNDEKAVDFASPFVLKILSGGELSDKLSYYFYFLLNERGTIAGVEDAFLMYHDLFGSGINISLGQFQASDPLYKGELRFTLEPYEIYAAAPGNSNVDLRYDRGIVLDKGFSSGTTVVFQVVNGNGIGGAGEGWKFDRDKYKNVMLRLNQSAGPVSIGVFGYAGKEELFLGVPAGVNKIWMAGPDLSLDLNERFMVSLQYLMRNDSRVFTGMGLMNDVKTSGGFAELIYSPAGDRSNWYLTGLVNYVNSDDDFLDYSSATLHGGYLIRRNVRLMGEYTYQFSGNPYGRLSAGFSAAF
jgi:hypothetical protein